MSLSALTTAIKANKDKNRISNILSKLSAADKREIAGEEGAKLLKRAIDHNNPETILLLLLHGANPNVLVPITGSKRATPFWWACTHLKLNIVKLMLNNQKNPIQINQRCDDIGLLDHLFMLHLKATLTQMTMPHTRAAGRERLQCLYDMIDALIQFAKKQPGSVLRDFVNTTSAKTAGYPPLYSLMSVGETVLPFIRLLANNGADLNAHSAEGGTPLLIALQGNEYKCVEALLMAGADPFFAAKDGRKPIEHCIRCGNLELFQLLYHYSQKDGVNFADECFCMAAFHGNVPVLNFLRKKISSFDCVDQSGTTPLICAASGGHVKVVKWLLQCKADPNKKCKRNSTALQAASACGHAAVVELLAPLTHKPGRGQQLSSVFEAIKHGEGESLAALLRNGHNIDQTYADTGMTPVHCAAALGKKEMVTACLAAGADPNIADVSGASALLVAADKGFTEIAEMLLKYKKKPVDIEYRDQRGGTALHLAAQNGHYLITKMLLEAGANVNVVDLCGNTPLFSTVIKNQVKCAELLLNNKANINHSPSTPDVGMRVLYWAVECASIQLMRLFMRFGANPNLPMAFLDGKTIIEDLLTKEDSKENRKCLNALGYHSKHLAKEKEKEKNSSSDDEPAATTTPQSGAGSKPMSAISFLRSQGYSIEQIKRMREQNLATSQAELQSMSVQAGASSSVARNPMKPRWPLLSIDSQSPNVTAIENDPFSFLYIPVNVLAEQDLPDDCLDAFRQRRAVFDPKHVKHIADADLSIVLSSATGEQVLPITHELKIPGKERLLCFPLTADNGRSTLYVAACYLQNGLHTQADIAQFKASKRVITVEQLHEQAAQTDQADDLQTKNQIL